MEIGKPMAKVTDPNLLSQLNATGVQPAPRPSGTPPLSQNPIMRQRQLANLLNQAELAKTPAELTRLNLQVQQLQADIAKGPGFTESQAKSMARYVNEKMGEIMYQYAVRNKYEPTDISNKIANTAEGIPKAGPYISDWIRNPVAEIARTGERTFQEGIKRELTGAATNLQEPGQVAVQYHPHPWQSINPVNREFQKSLRDQQIAAAARSAGIPPSGRSPEDQQALDWANKNPRDSRSSAIKRRLGF